MPWNNFWFIFDLKCEFRNICIHNVFGVFFLSCVCFCTMFCHKNCFVCLYGCFEVNAIFRRSHKTAPPIFYKADDIWSKMAKCLSLMIRMTKELTAKYIIVYVMSRFSFSFSVDWLQLPFQNDLKTAIFSGLK